MPSPEPKALSSGKTVLGWEPSKSTKPAGGVRAVDGTPRSKSKSLGASGQYEFMASSFVTLGEPEENLSEPGFLLEANYTLLMELL